MYQIGTVTVKTKAKAQEFAKTILNRGEVGSALTGKELDYMLDFFATFHHAWPQKKGLGVAEIRRQMEPNYGKYRAFAIERIDGSTTGIAYTISSIQSDNAAQRFRTALRQIVRPQIDEFRQKAFAECETVICPLTKQPVTAATCHIDHLPPTFETLVKSFIRSDALTDLQSLLKPHRDNQTTEYLSSAEMAEDFYFFHKMNARLRVLSPTANLSHAKNQK